MKDKILLSAVVDRRRVMQGGAAVFATASIAGMLPARAETKKRIGVGQPDRTADFYQGFMDSVLAEADKRGYEVVQSFSGSTPEKQLAELNAWVAQGIEALVVMPLDRNTVSNVVKQAHEAGLLFVGYANVIPDADGYLKWDDISAGTEMGNYIAKFVNERLGGKAEVGLLVFPNHQATVERIASTREALSKAIPDGITYWEVQAVLAAEALVATQSLLQAHPEIKVIVCCADDGALGARSAFMNSGLNTDNVFLCGFDGSNQNLQLIKEKDPFIRASAALDIAEVGRQVVAIPDNIFKGVEPREVALPYVLVTQETDVATIERLQAVYKS